MKKFNILMVLSLISISPVFAAGLDCVVPNSNGERGFSVNFDTPTQISLGNGGELGGSYLFDPTQTNEGYVAYRIMPATQNGQQPVEVIISRQLLNAPGAQAPVWIAGGVYECRS